MTTTARGTFDVTMVPRLPADEAGNPIGRMSLDKRFHGDLAATSVGQMLAFRTDVAGSAGYVAMERVTGSLAGREGSFVLQHTGTMKRGASSLTIFVVPDSGTEQLTGLVGTMKIEVEGDQHFYSLAYSLPDES